MQHIHCTCAVFFSDARTKMTERCKIGPKVESQGQISTYSKDL